jgi:putative acetyltransferase
VHIEILIIDPFQEESIHLLRTHLDFCLAATPTEHVYALDIEKFNSPEITVFGARIAGDLVAIGALRKLDDAHAELKSMHTLVKARGQGIGRALVSHIEATAKELGILRLSLETGTSEAFKPARELYKSLGYADCEAFGEYELSEDNICMTKSLT